MWVMAALVLGGCATFEAEVAEFAPKTPSEPQAEAPQPEPAALAALSAPAVDPSRVWIATDALPTGRISVAPPRAAWPATIKSQRVPGWTLAKIHGRRRSPHDANDGLFASRSGARRFAVGRHAMQTADTGSCFRAEWPSRFEDTGVETADLEPMVIPEPHVRARGGWSGKIGWVQGARWVEAAVDGSWIRLEFREGWMQTSPARIGGVVKPYEVRFERVGRVESRGERFSVFAARGDDRLHVLTVPQTTDGRLVTKGPLRDTDLPRHSIPCAWQRLVVETEPRHQWLRSALKPGRVWKISARSVERDGASGVELALDHVVDPE